MRKRVDMKNAFSSVQAVPSVLIKASVGEEANTSTSLALICNYSISDIAVTRMAPSAARRPRSERK